MSERGQAAEGTLDPEPETWVHAQPCSADYVIWVCLLIALYLSVFIVKKGILIAALPA